MIQISKKNHMIETTEDLKMFLPEKGIASWPLSCLPQSVTDATAATDFVHRAVTDAFEYHAATLVNYRRPDRTPVS
jgi:hypothetical protein